MLKFDDLLAAANTQYANLQVEVAPGDTFLLRNALQLDKAERDALVAATKRHEESEAEGEEGKEADEREVIDMLRDALRIAADNADAVERLFEKIGDNLAVMLVLWKQYNEGTQVGEA